MAKDEIGKTILAKLFWREFSQATYEYNNINFKHSQKWTFNAYSTFFLLSVNGHLLYLLLFLLSMGAFTNSIGLDLDWIADPFGLDWILIKSNPCLQIRGSDFKFF